MSNRNFRFTHEYFLYIFDFSLYFGTFFCYTYPSVVYVLNDGRNYKALIYFVKTSS